jgi:hypothetical protein
MDLIIQISFRQFTMGRMGWLCLWIITRPFMIRAEGFSFKYLHLESCGISVLQSFNVFRIWFLKVIVGFVLMIWK